MHHFQFWFISSLQECVSSFYFDDNFSVVHDKVP